MNRFSTTSHEGALGHRRRMLSFSGIDDELAAAASVVPPVTVVLEGRAICHRVSLEKHTSYRSLAGDLRRMYLDLYGVAGSPPSDSDVDIADAVPGHLVAYEDMEDDLLLVGDLKWQDFVRVVKRIRIIPVKDNTRKMGTSSGGNFAQMFQTSTFI